MGAVHFSLDVHLVEYLKRALPLSTFVETGTFEGASVELCLPYFERIHTVELSDAYYRAAIEKFKEMPRVRVWSGTSVNCLRELSGVLHDESVLYWLDAHWCAAEDVGGGAAQCPLLEELDALAHLNEQSVVCIDDARLFLCPPPEPQQNEDWPSFHEVVGKLSGLSATHELLIVNDVMLFYPVSSRQAVYGYARQHGVDWLSLLGKARDYDRYLPIVQEEADRRAAGLEELTAVIAARDGQIKDLEGMARERLDALHELTAVIAARDQVVSDLEKMARERLAGLHELTALIAGRDERIADLERTARERLDALRRADTLLKEAKNEVEPLRELIAAIAVRDEQIATLEQTAQGRLDALQRAEAELRDMAEMLVARNQTLVHLSERITALEAQEHMLKQKVLLFEEESVADFLARRAKALWSR